MTARVLFSVPPNVKVTVAVLEERVGLEAAVRVTEPAPVPEDGKNVSHVWSLATDQLPVLFTVTVCVPPPAVALQASGEKNGTSSKFLTLYIE